jgi:hypothetical protein
MGTINIGDQLYCTKGDWLNGNGIKNFQTPKQDEVVTVQDVRVYEGRTLLSFKEYHPDVYYPAKFFKPKYHLFSIEVIKSITVLK